MASRSIAPLALRAATAFSGGVCLSMTLFGCHANAPLAEPQEDNADGTINCEGLIADDYPDRPARFGVRGERATMWGYITRSTPRRVEKLLDDHPEVDTVVMPFVPGSANDEANLRAARMIRDAGLNTCVPSTGLIASGGVDFFVAGTRRSAADGAEVGVHSWATGSGVEGKDVPKTDSQHQSYLSYYEDMGIPEDFYWFTLEAAPADSVHNMTRAELEEYGLLAD